MKITKTLDEYVNDDDDKEETSDYTNKEIKDENIEASKKIEKVLNKYTKDKFNAKRVLGDAFTQKRLKRFKTFKEYRYGNLLSKVEDDDRYVLILDNARKLKNSVEKNINKVLDEKQFEVEIDNHENGYWDITVYLER